MKRIIFGMLLAGMCYLIRTEGNRALALMGNEYLAEDPASCFARKVTIDFPRPSFSITRLKTDPKNPIVIGQDKEKRGVDITVTISSLPGTARIPHWVTTEYDGGYYWEDGDAPEGMICNQPKSGRM
jgi:hypothetical protein